MKITALFVSAGIFFGIWPILMNKSGLPGFASAALFAGMTFLFIMPVAISSGQLQQVNLSSLLIYAVFAAAAGALGLLTFNTGLAEVKQERVGNMFMVMVMVQLAAPAIYQMLTTGDLSPKRILGAGGTFVVAYLLTS